MKGIILAGGHGTRLRPLTTITNKHLIGVYDKPMILYPLGTLIRSGIKEILIVSGREHAGHFVEYLGSGKDFGVKLTYKVQEEAGGIAQAIALAEGFAAGEPITVILGDNIFEDSFASAVKSFKAGAAVFLKAVPDAHRFGVATLRGKKVTHIVEKPAMPHSNLAVTGIYQYDNNVFDIIRKLKPSARGELEVTDVNMAYLEKGRLRAGMVKGFWSDAGTFDSLARAIDWAMKKQAK